jgi:hypothetical protein
MYNSGCIKNYSTVKGKKEKEVKCSNELGLRNSDLKIK